MKNEITINLKLRGEPAAVVDALANGLPTSALEAIRDRLCVEAIKRQGKPAKGRRRITIKGSALRRRRS